MRPWVRATSYLIHDTGAGALGAGTGAGGSESKVSHQAEPVPPRAAAQREERSLLRWFSRGSKKSKGDKVWRLGFRRY